MQAQAQSYEGYWENERFYPLEQPIRRRGRVKAILTFVADTEATPAAEDEFSEQFAGLVDKVGLPEAQKRVAWLKRLNDAIAESMDDEPFELPPRAGGLRPPIFFED